MIDRPGGIRRKSERKPGRIGRIWTYMGTLIEAAEEVPAIGGLLGSLIKLGFVLFFFAIVVGLIAVFVIIADTFTTGP